MFCLVYRSIQNPVLGQNEIRSLLEQVKDFNRANDITGCLLFYNDEFVQYLEGDKQCVEALFEKIKQDWRHSEVNVLISGHINVREFENWSMAYENFMGPNFRLEYLKLLVSSYFENTDTYKYLNPATKKFWVVVKTLLATQAVEKFI
ncbi:BLUF domain-containing protein [Pricia sp.]|uniref:BLUF domain-containing protein n=1 Tax=Pricia sp. TaxID=2268138 RepID=UPI003593C43C